MVASIEIQSFGSTCSLASIQQKADVACASNLFSNLAFYKKKLGDPCSKLWLRIMS